MVSVMANKKIDAEEQKMLCSSFSEFIRLLDNKTIVNPRLVEPGSVAGLCAVYLEISVDGTRFYFTRASS